MVGCGSDSRQGKIKVLNLQTGGELEYQTNGLTVVELGGRRTVAVGSG